MIMLFLKFFIGYSPYYVRFNQESHWMLWTHEPANGTTLKSELLQAQHDWSKIKTDLILWPILSKGTKQFFTDQEWRKPFTTDPGRFHFLGTYELGRDLFTSCLLGMQKSLWIAFISILIAMVFGLPLGVGAAFLQFRKLSSSVPVFIISIILMLISIYMIFISAELKYFSIYQFLFIGIIFTIIYFLISTNEKSKILLNTDSWLMNAILIVKSIPIMLILLLLLQWIQKPGVISISIIIGVYLSLSVAKYARYITHSSSKDNHIQSLISLGYSNQRIIIYHLIPAVFKNLIPLLALYIASVILVEAGISFLGLGLPIEELSLGSIMQTARTYPSAWWVILFPGLCIFWMVYCFQSINTLHWDRESL